MIDRRLGSGTFRRPKPLLRAACTSVFAFLAIGAFSKSAEAQEWLKDRRYQEGLGLHIGEFELHPGIAGEVGYDSNWFARTSKSGPQYENGAPLQPVVDAGTLRITPSLSLQSMGQQRQAESPGGSSQPPPTSFKAGVSGTYREFLGPAQIRDQRNISGNANMRLEVGVARPVGAAFSAGYTRTIQSSASGDPNSNFNRSDLTGGADLVLTPGGGTLDFRFGYSLTAALYEQSNAVPFTNLTHEFSERSRWRFTPRTSIFHDATFRFITFPYSDRSISALNGSTPVRTRIGLTGLVTTRFSTLLAAGYGASFYENSSAPNVQNYESINAQAEGTFYLTANPATDPGGASMSLTSLSVGYMRDFRNSLIGGFYGTDRGYARLSAFFGGRVLLSAEASGEAMSFGDVYYNQGTAGALTRVKVKDAFTNVRIGSTLFGEYRFTNTLGVNATLDYSQVISDVELPSLDAGGVISPTQVFAMSYQRFQAFLGVRWFL